MMKLVCAWCGAVLRAGSQQEKVSHGICQDCADVLYKEAEDAT